MIKYLYTLVLICLVSFIAAGQTGPSDPLQDSILIFVRSGVNQILIPFDQDEFTSTISFSAESSNTDLLEVADVLYTPGQTFALCSATEKGLTGVAELTIQITDGIVNDQKTLDIHIVEYDNFGLNFEIHDMVFWQENVPVSSPPIFDTIIDSGAGPYDHLNYNNIPLTVNLDCQTSPPCTGHDFYTAFYRGYLVPPTTGTYHIVMESADRFGFWISANSSYTNMQNILYNGSNSPNVGENIGNNRKRSIAVELVAGQVYAFYATQWIIHTTIGGILWEGPGIETQFIPDDYLRHTYDTEKPTAPGILVAEWVSTTQAGVTFPPSQDNRNVSGYNVYLDGIRANDQLLSFPEIRISNLVPETNYFVVATAVDALGNESFVSETTTFQTFTTDELPPSPPTELNLIKPTGLALEIEWSGAVDAQTQVIAYNIYINGELYNADDYIFDETIIIRGLQPSTSYEVTLRAFDTSFNASALSEVFNVATTDFDPMDDGLGEKRGRLIVHNRNISWNEGIGLNVPYENGNYPNNQGIRNLVEEFGSGAVRWGAITANSRSFSGSTGTSPSNNNTYARIMAHANEIGAFFALTVGVQDGIDYMTEPTTFLRLLEYLNGPADSPGGAIRASEGFTEPLLPDSKGVILEFGNEVWGAGAHDAQIGANYENYAQWVRDMIDLMKTSPYYDPDKIIFTYSGRYPHPGSSYNINTRVLTGDDGRGDCLAVSGYLGGNLNYDPEVAAGESELDYFKNGVDLLQYTLQGFELTAKEMVSLTGSLKTFYLYESNMTTSSFNGRFGQAVIMTDYFAASMRYGSIVPTIFHLTGGQWRITRPAENYKRLPLYFMGKFFNRFGKGHVLETTFETNNVITNSNGQQLALPPIGGYAYNNGEDFALMFINRDFTDDYMVQVQLPEDITFSTQATLYTLWNDDFSSFETNIDSVEVSLVNGMLVNIPKHAMVILAAQGTDPEYAQLPHGYYDRLLPDSIDVYTDGDRLIDTNRGTENIYGYVYPEDAFNSDTWFEVIENTANAEFVQFFTQPRLRVRGSGECGDDGLVKVIVRAADNIFIADTVTIEIINQGIDCDVSVDDIWENGRAFVYPNPVNDVLYVSEDINERVIIEIFDINGRMILRRKLEEGYAINTANFANGLFMVRLIDPSGKVTQGKVQVNH